MEWPLRAAGEGALPGPQQQMTRIVSGRWSGRRLQVPTDRRLRPTAERVREAWLNILGPELPNARVLDLCAGTGALGLEALSRGAAHVTFVETNVDALRLIRTNIAALDADASCDVRRTDALRFLSDVVPAAFDVAVADPPFTTELAQQIAAAWHVTPFASVLAIEHPRTMTLAGGESRRWGDIAVTFFRAP